MAYYFYVKSGYGTRAANLDSPFTSEQTGAFSSLTASDVYATIEDAMDASKTNDPTDGDFIRCSDVHAASYAVGNNISCNVGGSFNGTGLRIESVDDANCENYSPGAKETFTDSYQWDLRFNGKIAGVDLESPHGNGVFSIGSAWRWTLQDATFTASASNAPIFYNTGGGSIIYVNDCTIDTGANAGTMCRLFGGSLIVRGGSMASSGGGCAVIGNSFAVNAPSYLDIKGMDLTAMTAEFSDSNLNSSSTDNTGLIRLHNNELSTTAMTLRTIGTTKVRFEMFNSDQANTGPTSGTGVQHRIWIEDGAGKVINNQSTYITNDPNINEGTSNPFSLEVTTSSICSQIHPFIFTLPAQYVDLGNAAEDVITLEIVTASTLTLTSADISARLIYPDSANTLQPNWVVTHPVATGFLGVDPTSSGSTLSSSSLGAGDWTGEPASSPNFYKIDLDTSGDAGEGSAVAIEIEIRKASIASGTLYISPFVTLS